MRAPGQNYGLAEGFYPGPTVLLVDDEPLIRWALGEAIREAGYSLYVAATGAEAVEALGVLERQRLIVLLDLRLPDVVDLSLFTLIRTRRPDAPVFVLSAWASAEVLTAAIQAGAAGVVKKPFDVAAVVAAVGAASDSPSPSYTR